MDAISQKMRSGWCRFGIVASVIWFIGFSGYFYYEAKEEILKEEISKGEISKGEISNEKKSQLIDSQLKYCVTHSNGEAEFDICADSVRRLNQEINNKNQRLNDNIQRTNNNIQRKGEEFTALIPIFVVVNLVTIIVGWLLAWFGIMTARWIRRGFA
jgi:hypothetical protein